MALAGLAARLLLRSVPLVSRQASVIHGASIALDVLDWMTALNRLRSVVGVLRLARERGVEDVAEEMVRRMRADGPDDTYRLERGTVWERPDGTVVVKASAIRETVGRADDYAPYVEWGTSDTEAQPFFWDNARAVLEEFGLELEQALDEAGQQE